MIAPLLPNKSPGVPRVDDRRVLNVHWVCLHTTYAGIAALRSACGPPGVVRYR